MHISALLFSTNYCNMVRYKFQYTGYCPPCFASWDIDPITTRDGQSQHLSQPYSPPLFSKAASYWLELMASSSGLSSLQTGIKVTPFWPNLQSSGKSPHDQTLPYRYGQSFLDIYIYASLVRIHTVHIKGLLSRSQHYFQRLIQSFDKDKITSCIAPESLAKRDEHYLSLN